MSKLVECSRATQVRGHPLAEEGFRALSNKNYIEDIACEHVSMFILWSRDKHLGSVGFLVDQFMSEGWCMHIFSAIRIGHKPNPFIVPMGKNNR